MNRRRLILEDRIGAVVFGLLSLGGVCGILAGNAVHLFTVTAGGLVSWALWYEAKQLSKTLNS